MAELQSPPRKRPRPEYEDIISVNEESNGYSATIHGIVTSVSPMKGQSEIKFFDGYISDGKKKIRFVGFNSDKAKLLEEHAHSKQSVALSNCRIKQAKSSSELEVMVGDRTDVTNSAISFEVDDESTVTVPETKTIVISELQDQPPFTKITTSAKIIEIDEVVTLYDGRKVQNVGISDTTGRAKLALWEDNINLVELNKSYRFSNLVVKTFNEHNTLFTPKNGLVVDTIDNIDALPLLASIKMTKSLTDAKVIAVANFSSGHLCLNCKQSKLDSLENNSTFGKCPKCLSTVDKKSCIYQVSAILHLVANAFKFQLTASGVNLSAIVENELEDVTELSLLQASPFNATYSTTNMTITNISRAVGH